MITTIGELTSQIRNLSKSINQDNLYISDRLIFSLIKKHAALFFSREDGKWTLSKMRFLYTTLPFVELIEVNKVEAKCTGIKSNCTIKRTKEKIPPLLKGYYGPLIGNILSIDGSESLLLINLLQYIRKVSSPDFKYNKLKYAWLQDDYLYFPDLEWNAIRLEVMLEEDALDDCGNIDPCKPAQEVEFPLPEFLQSTIMAEVLKDISFLLQVPGDETTDKKSTSG